MSVFLVIPLANNLEEVDKAVRLAIPESDSYRLQGDAGWLVNFNGTSIDLCNTLGITGQPAGERSPVGSTLVSPVTSYYGRGPSDMWEWMRVKLEAGS